MELTDELSITLTAAEWNTVLAVLDQAAYRLVAPIIVKITAQAQAAGTTAPAPAPRPHAVAD